MRLRLRIHSGEVEPATAMSASTAAPAPACSSNRAMAGTMTGPRAPGGAALDAGALAEQGVAGPSRPLPHLAVLRSAFGSHAGALTAARAHVGPAAATASRHLGARAYTIGDDVAFAARPDVRTTAHEAAHVVHQGARRGLSRPGEASEATADAVAARVAAGRRADDLLDHRPAAVAAVQREAERVTSSVEGFVVGHASPRWERPHGREKAELNLELSQRRAEEVAALLGQLFASKLAVIGVGGPVSVDVAPTCVDHDDVPGADQLADVPAVGLGDLSTLVEGGGNAKVNDAAMRRAQLAVTVTHVVEGEAPMSVPQEQLETCADHATNQWSIRAFLSAGASHLGVGGAGLVGQLKNRRTGSIAPGFFVGGGLGVGVQTPGVALSDEWSDFETEDVCTHHDFDGTLARLTAAGAGVKLIGYGLAFISFPLRGANGIYIGGWNVGALGIDAGTNVGIWELMGRTPGPTCDEPWVHHVVVTETERYAFSDTVPHDHQVFFDTGEHAVSSAELAALELFIDAVLAEYVSRGGAPVAL